MAFTLISFDAETWPQNICTLQLFNELPFLAHYGLGISIAKTLRHKWQELADLSETPCIYNAKNAFFQR